MNTTPSLELEARLLDQTEEILFLLDPATLRICAANRRACERLGYERAQLLDKAITDIACALSDVFYWEETLSGKLQEIHSAEGLFQCADGNLFPVEESVRLVRDGKQNWLALRARDLSAENAEREQLALATSQLRATLEATADGILVLDHAGVIVNMNRRLASIWVFPEDLLMRARDEEVFAYMASCFTDPTQFNTRFAEISALLEEDTIDLLELANGHVLEQKTCPHYLDERIIGRVYTYTDVTERRQAESLLRQREHEFRTLVESSPDNIIRYDRDCRAVYINQMFGRSLAVQSAELLGKLPEENNVSFMPDDDQARYQNALQEVARTGTTADLDVEVTDPYGEPRIHHIRFVAERDNEGGIIGVLAFGRDITERKQAEIELRVAAVAFESQEAIAITDPDQIILRVNNAFTRITGYTTEDAVGKTIGSLLKSGRHDSRFYAEMWDALNHEGHWQGEIWNRRKNGAIYPEWLTITVVKDEHDNLANYVAAFSDTSHNKQAEAEIHTLAFYDPLTELPNRRLLMDRLSHNLATSQRNHRSGAVLLIDLDHFKELNDTKGHGVGDLLLIEVAKRLRSCLRADDTVARLGGDEFVVILSDLGLDSEHAAVQAELIAEKIRTGINQPASLQGHEYHGSTSVGICMFSGQDLSVDDLIKRADIAMYQAKRSGRNAIRFFDPATHAAMETRIALEADLRRALPQDQFRLYYQMQVDQDQRIVGAEALLRWQHPVRGLVSPLDFIPLAEDTGQIVSIGRWVLEKACIQLKAWEADPLTRGLSLAVNVSAREFKQDAFVGQVREIIERTAIDPYRLKLELTESLVLDDVGNTIVKMEMLRQIGVLFSLDDFGTGYSSLAYLSRLPLDQVKIDQSFVSKIGIETRDQVIVHTIIGMAKNLGLTVIAEGVETRTQLEFLKRSGCLLYQGYLLGRPMPLDAFRQALADGVPGSVFAGG